MTKLHYDLFQTEMGWVAALASDRGLRRLSLKPVPQEAMDGLGSAASWASQDSEALKDVRVRLDAHFRGEDGRFDEVPLDLEDAPPFFKAAWDACRSIPGARHEATSGWRSRRATRAHPGQPARPWRRTG